MAARDPETRSRAARTAALARTAGLDTDGRRAMTARARQVLREEDLRAVDEDARRAGEHPLDEYTRNTRADARYTARAKAASEAHARQSKKNRPGAGTVQASADHEARPH